MPAATASTSAFPCSAGAGGALAPDDAIDILRQRLERAGCATAHPSAAVAVPAEALGLVLALVDGGVWDEFDGHRRWAGPWRRVPR